MVSTTLIDLLKPLSFLGPGREIRPCPVQAIYTHLYSILKNASLLSDEGILGSFWKRAREINRQPAYTLYSPALLVVVWQFSVNQHYDFSTSVVVVWQFSANQHYDYVASVVVILRFSTNQHYGFVASVVVVWRFSAKQHYIFVSLVVVVVAISSNQHYDRKKSLDGQSNLRENRHQNWHQKDFQANHKKQKNGLKALLSSRFFIDRSERI